MHDLKKESNTDSKYVVDATVKNSWVSYVCASARAVDVFGECVMGGRVSGGGVT